ncbi:MAG: aminoacyl-tRNA hydrolase [Candidatus Neomarinimicrobiota bacterium]
MIAFVGLGNVGSEYASTKHNLGFWVADELAQRWRIPFRPGKGDYLMAEATPAGSSRVLLVKPTCGMNRSGKALKEIEEGWSLSSKELHVIVDDVDLPLGTIRIRPGGGSASHKGMESIIYTLGTTQFPRIRVGIGTDEQMRPAERYVLKPFLKKDKALAQEMVIRGADAAEAILSVGLEKAMAGYNRAEREAWS